MPRPADPPNAEADDDSARDAARIDEIVARGPAGTFAVVGLATFIVIAMFVLFYFLVFLPRGAIQ